MKKLKIGCLILVISVCMVSFFVASADDGIQTELGKWWYNIGRLAKKHSGKTYTNNNIVSYINGIPVYEYEIIDRMEKNKDLFKEIDSQDDSYPPPFPRNPFDYVYREKFDLYYAGINGIKVSKEEVEEYIAFQKSEWESSEESRDIFNQYLLGRGITAEEFYNEIAPAAYEKKMLKSKVKQHIFQEAGMNGKDINEKHEYLEKFYKENIKVKEVNKSFIEKYN